MVGREGQPLQPRIYSRHLKIGGLMSANTTAGGPSLRFGDRPAYLGVDSTPSPPPDQNGFRFEYISDSKRFLAGLVSDVESHLNASM